MRLFRRISAAVLMLLVLFSAAPGVRAADGTVTYNGTAREFIFEPGSRYSPTDLFPNFKDVMPGDTLTQHITVRNKASNRVKVKIYMRALGAHADSEYFLSQMQLTVWDNSDTVMFDAAANRTSGLTDWTCLGTLYSGGEADLSVILEVPVSMDNRFQNAVGYLDWQFMVEEFPIEITDPKTGDVIFYYAAILAASAAGLVFLLILWKKRKKKD